MADLARENPDEEWLQQPDIPPEDVEFQPWHRLYFEAFDALKFDRQFGALGGQMPISYQALSRYARDHGIVGTDFWMFQRFMIAIDAEWLDIQAERAPRNGS